MLPQSRSFPSERKMSHDLAKQKFETTTIILQSSTVDHSSTLTLRVKHEHESTSSLMSSEQ